MGYYLVHIIQQYFHYFIVCILDPYVLWFSFWLNIVAILISVVFRGAALIIRGEALTSMWIPKGAALIWDPALIRGNTVFYRNVFIAVGLLKRKERTFVRTQIPVLSLTINYFGKQVNHFFLTKIINVPILNLLKVILFQITMKKFPRN